jgi:hypothetical protein
MSRASVTAEIDDRTHRKLSQFARKRRRSKADILRDALEAYLFSPPSDQSGESCYDVAMRHGVIGMARDLPPDLSTNRKHFEGFGQ